MQQFRLFVLLVLAAFGGVSCSDTPSGPGTSPSPDLNTMPALIVSEALSVARVEAVVGPGSVTPIAYLSLPPGTLSSVVSVRIRNLATSGVATMPVPIIDGGFDPIAVPAGAGDRLEIALTDGNGRVTTEYATVPAKRPPVVVRTAPPGGRTDVAFSVRPVVVFSEPIDAATLPVGMRMVTGGTLVTCRIDLIEPWIAELAPNSALEPGTTYELEITQDVRDLVGTALGAAVTVTFTTQPTGESFEPRIAFVRSTQPGPDGIPGPPSIYVARSDGSRVTHLTSGESPAWSPDGRSIAFVRAGQLRLINPDGSGERILTDAAHFGWSPDGTKIVFISGSGSDGDISALSITSPEAPSLLNAANGLFPASPQWSPDGRSISFLNVGDWDFTPGQLFVMNADGSDPRPLEVASPPCQGIESCEYRLGPPSPDHAWSPDGSRIAASFRIYYPYTLARPDRWAWALATVDGSGADLRIHFAEPREDALSYLAHPAWSPDGRSVAFEEYELSSGCQPPACPMRIWVVRMEDGSARQLIPDRATREGPDYWDSQPTWSHAAD